MNGVAPPKRDSTPQGPYFPFHRDETYPRTLCVNFKRLEYRTLQRYCKLHGINVRPDCTQSELAVAAARHFQEAPSVDEEGVMTSFLQRVVDPERPYRPAIDLALAALGNAGDKERGRHGQPMVISSDADPVTGAGSSPVDGEGSGGGGEARGDLVGGGGGHYQASLDVPDHPRMMQGYDEGGRMDGYSRRGGGMMKGMMGDGGGRRGDGGRGGSSGRYEPNDYEYGANNGRDRAVPQMSPSWETESHGGDTMPSKTSSKKSPVGRSRFNGSGSNSSRGPSSSGSSATNAPTHGGGAAMTDRGAASSRGGSSGDGGEESKSRKQKQDRNGGAGGSGSGGSGAGGGGAGDASVKSPPGKKRKGGGGWRAKNGEQVAVKDDRGEPGSWILARVIKYTPETHQYELRDDDDKEGLGGLTAPRSSVIRLEDNTKGLVKGDRVLAVFPDTTSFYLGTVHRVPKVAATAEKRIEIKFQDDEDATGRTPARPMPARYVVLMPDGYDEEAGQAKAEEEEADAEEEAVEPEAGTGSRAAGGAGGRGGSRGESDTREEDFGDAMDKEDGEDEYAYMIRAALLKLPQRQGTIPMVYAYIEENFHDRLDWKSDSSVRRTPAWKSGVRRTLTQHPSFCHAGTPERNVYTLAE